MPRDLFITVDFSSDLKQLPTLARYLLALVRKILLLEWTGKLASHEADDCPLLDSLGRETHCSQRPAH